jgi:hypothetical protein
MNRDLHYDRSPSAVAMRWLTLAFPVWVWAALAWITWRALAR